MIALDTNLLVYAHREDSPHHEAATRALTDAVAAAGGVAIPWPCLHEFLAIVTHPRIYDPPTPVVTALYAVQALADAPSVHLIGEGASHLGVLAELLKSGPLSARECTTPASRQSVSLTESTPSGRSTATSPGFRLSRSSIRSSMD